MVWRTGPQAAALTELSVQVYCDETPCDFTMRLTTPDPATLLPSAVTLKQVAYTSTGGGTESTFEPSSFLGTTLAANTLYGVEVSATTSANTLFGRWYWTDNTTFDVLSPGWHYTGYASMAPGTTTYQPFVRGKRPFRIVIRGK
ncbi:hypothetical protein ABPG75_005934 [Micractinium tetrahymenae]